MSENEKNLMLHLQQRVALFNDMQAYRQLFNMLYPQLLKFSISFVKSHEIAEEIVSDAFIKLWELNKELIKIQNVKVYLFTITKNLSLNYITRHKKELLVSLDEVEPTTLFHFTNPETAFISQETTRAIDEAVSQLPPQCRMIFYLVKEGGFSYKEVAEVMDISVNTVRNQLATALKKIADALPLSIKKSFTSIFQFSQS